MPQYSQVQPGQLFPGQLYSQSLPAGRPPPGTPYLASSSHTLPPPNRPPGQVATPAASLYGSHYRPSVRPPSRQSSHSSPTSIYGNHVTQSAYAPLLARPPLDSRPASSFTPALPHLLTPPVASEHRRWSDCTGSPAIRSPPSRPIPNSRLSPTVQRMPPPPPPLPRSSYSSSSTTPVHRLPPYPMSPSSPAGPSAPSPLEELGKGEEEELARVLEMSRLLHEEEVRSRTSSHQRKIVSGLKNGAGNAGEDEDLALALEESLATARARTPSTLSPSDNEIQTGFLVAPSWSTRIVPRPQPSPGAMSPMDLSPPWQIPSVDPPLSLFAPSNPNRRTASYVSPTDSHRPTQRPPHSSSLPTAPTSNSSFYNAGVQQSSSAGPPSSSVPRRRPTGGSFVVRDTREDPSGLLSDSLASAMPEDEGSSTFSQFSDRSRELQPATSLGSLQGVPARADLQQEGVDGGLVWGHTFFQPPSLAPASVQFGVSLSHHSTGSLYVIAPCYSALLTGLFAIANVLIEGGEETRLAVQFVRMSSDDDEAITILWIESGRLDVPPQEPIAENRPALRVRTSTGSSTSSGSSKSLSSQSILRKSPRKPSVHRAQPSADQVEVVTPKGLQPPTGIYTSSSLIFQHPSFLSYNARAPDRPGPERRSSLVALPSPTMTLLSVSDLLAHLLSLTPSALADVLSLTSAARQPSASNYSSTSDSSWPKKERDHFLTLVAEHTPEEADLAMLNDDDERTGESAGAKSKTEGEKSKRRWIKEHLVGGKMGSSDGAGSQQKKHPLVRLSKEKKDQVAEAADFITPFSFPSDPHT